MGHPYDKNGKISEKGNINYKLLNKLNSLEYYKNEGPKSLGIEYVNEKVIPLIDSLSINNNDVLNSPVKVYPMLSFITLDHFLGENYTFLACR